MQGAGCRVQGSGFKVQGVGFRAQGSGLRVQDLGFKVEDPGSGMRVQGAGFRVQGSGFRVQGSGCRVQGAGCRVQGSPAACAPTGHGAPLSAARTRPPALPCSPNAPSAVVLHKSTPPQIRQLVLHISNSKGYVDGFVGESAPMRESIDQMHCPRVLQ